MHSRRTMLSLVSAFVFTVAKVRALTDRLRGAAGLTG